MLYYVHLIHVAAYGVTTVAVAGGKQPEYGTLAPLVKTVGWLVSATGTIIWSFKRRNNWEPSEEDVDKGPQRVAGVLTAVGIAIIWTQLANVGSARMLVRLAIYFASGTLLFLLLYGLLIGNYIYKIVTTVAPNKPVERNIIGGFKLTRTAAAKLAAKVDLTVQALLCGGRYDPDLVWTRPSRALAKLAFVVGYIGLTFCGSVALVCAGVLLIVEGTLPT